MTPAQSTPKPKSKSGSSSDALTTLVGCDRCGSKHPGKWSPLHRDDGRLCEVLAGWQEGDPPPEELPSVAVHQFYFDGAGGCFRLVDAEDVGLNLKDVPGIIPKRANPHLVMDSSVMKLMGIVVGQPLRVWINGSGDGVLGIAWPAASSLSLGVFNVAIVGNDVPGGKSKKSGPKGKGKNAAGSTSSGGGFLLIRQFNQQPAIANLVGLVCLDDRLTIGVAEWERYCRNKFEGSFLEEGDILNVRYFGRILRMRVFIENATLSNDAIKCSESTNETDDLLGSSMADLSLNESAVYSEQASLLSISNVSTDVFAEKSFVDSMSPTSKRDSLTTSSVMSVDKSTHADVQRPVLVDGQIKANLLGQIYLCTEGTRFICYGANSTKTTGSELGPNVAGPIPIKSPVTFADLGGMESFKLTLRRHLIDPIVNTASSGFNENGAFVLVFGASGAGKTMLCKAVAGELITSLEKLSDSSGIEYKNFYFSPQTVSSTGGSIVESLKILDTMVDAMQTAGRGMLLLDDLDLLVRKDFWPSGTGGVSEAAFRFTKYLEQIFDRLTSDDDEKKNLGRCVSVVAMATERDKFPKRLWRKFELELDLPVPNSNDRRAILDKLLSKNGALAPSGFDDRIPSNLSSSEIAIVSDSTPGFTAGDLKSLVKSARRMISTMRPPDKGSKSASDYSQIFLDAAQLIRPSAIRDVLLEIPRITWDDIGGQEELKRKLKEVVELPLKFPGIFFQMGIQPSTGVLLYGPPGCSKTMIAKAIAAESRLNFLAVKGPELFNKWVGESERGVREIFRKARAAAPSVIFFDEIDVLAASRASTSMGGSGDGGSSNVGDRVLAQLLTELDGIVPRNQVIVLAATNRPDTIDPALLRPGRMDRLIYVPLPDTDTRRKIFKISFNKIPNQDLDQWFDRLVTASEGYSGAELVALCQEAAMNRIKVDLDVEGADPASLQPKGVAWSDFETALAVVKPGTSRQQMKALEEFCLKRQ